MPNGRPENRPALRAGPSPADACLVSAKEGFVRPHLVAPAPGTTIQAERLQNGGEALRGVIGSDQGRATPSASLDQGPSVGIVTSVDVGRLLVTLADDAAVERTSISSLVALPAAGSFLMGIVDGLTCAESSDQVVAHIMPVGAFYPAPGGGGTFRVGSAHQPRIRSECFLVEGESLSRFMAAITAGVSPAERLILGRYGDADGAEAVADGNRLFQRHVAILGNSGAGKSWAVALLLERAARLQNANLVVLDLHGEYGQLANGRIATRLRIGKPTDLEDGAQVDDAADPLYLPYWIFEIDELAMIVLNQDDPHAADQRQWLISRVEALKRGTLGSAGEYDEMASTTVDSPVPYELERLVSWAERDEVEQVVLQPSGKVVPGPYAGKLRSLLTRLEARRADPRFAFVFQPPDSAISTEWLPDSTLR